MSTRPTTTVSFGGRPVLASGPKTRPVRSGPSEVARRLASHHMIRQLGNGRGEIFMAPDFLTPQGCRRLIEMIRSKRRPSTVADSNGDASFRVSETCDMDSTNPVVADVRQNIANLLGIPLPHFETLQGQHYEPGGRFRRHSDAFRYDAPDFEKWCPGGNQRTWTAMVYLDHGMEGGHTVFDDLGVDMAPRAGTMLMWNNLNADGSINEATRHAGSDIVSGEKNIITAWARMRPWR